jgi:hypothetical protein
MERIKEDEYGQCTLYTCMKYNDETYRKCIKKGERRCWRMMVGMNVTKEHCKHISQ